DLQDKVGAQADVYSLGLVLRELLTGEMPEMPPGDLSPARELLYLLDRRPLLDVGVRHANPAIPHSLAAIVAKCLAMSVEDRYPSAESLANALQRFLQHQPLAVATTPSRRERFSNLVKRRRRVLAGICGILLFGALLGTLLARPSVEASPTFREAVGLVGH